MITITALYAGLLALLFLGLSWRVITYRRAKRLGLGDEGDKGLLKRMRAQANCAEYAPISLILILCLELKGVAAIWLHVAGIAVLAGRVIHGFGFSASPPKLKLRQLGMVLTLAAIVVTALANILLALIAL